MSRWRRSSSRTSPAPGEGEKNPPGLDHTEAEGGEILEIEKIKPGPRVLNARVLGHAVAVAVIVLVSLLLFYKHFATRGMLMHVDMTFPTSIGRNMMLYDHTWWQYGSVQNIWNMQRVFWTYPLLAVVRLLGISTDRYLLIMFTGTFALSGVSMYALATHVIRRMGLEGASAYATNVAAAFAGLVFIYNPFSVSHLWPYFGYPGYAVLPLAFLLLIKAVDSPRLWKALLLAVIITVAGTGPINVVWYWFMIIAYLVFFIASKKFSKVGLAAAGKVVLPLAGAYLLLNAAWVVPFAGSHLTGKGFAPSYIGNFTRPMLNELSRSGTILNNIRFTAGWGLPVDPVPRTMIHGVLSYALPVFALLSFVSLGRKALRERIVVFWTIMFALSVLLATGTSWILAGPYSWFVLKAPLISAFGWVFRAADRWLIYAALFYSLMLGLLAAGLMGGLGRPASDPSDAREKDAPESPSGWDLGRWRGAASVLGAAAVIAITLASFVPIALPYAKHVYDPTTIPADYERSYDYMEAEAPGARPVWLPFARDGFRYSWAPEKRVGPFDVYSSNASLNNLVDIYDEDSLYYWLESVYARTFLGPGEVLNRDVMMSDDLASRLFIPFCARYLVLDSSVPGYSLGRNLRSEKSLHNVYQAGDLDVFEFDVKEPHIRAATRTVLIDTFYDMLAVVRKLEPGPAGRIAFAGGRAGPGGRFGAIDIDDFMVPVGTNGGFEEVGADGKPVGWAIDTGYFPYTDDPAARIPDVLKGASRAVAVFEEDETLSGKRSLKVVNPSSANLALYAVIGSEVAVTEGDVYNISTDIKYKNSNWTHVTVEGFDTSEERWVRLVNCPPVRSGTARWTHTDYSFYMPGGISRMRPVLLAGWAADRSRPAISWFDEVRLSRVSEELFSDLAAAPRAPEVTFERKSPEEYEVEVRGAEEPYVLVFGEAYDPLWIARLDDGGIIDPAKAYNTVNGYPVSRTGDLSLTLEYLPQGWFVLGLVVSLAALVVCLAYPGFLYFKRRRARR